MTDYDKMVLAFDSDRWHQCGVIADLCEEQGEQYLARAWRWIAANKRWPYKHKTRELWGWYTVPSEDEKWIQWRNKRESAVPDVLIGGSRVRMAGANRRRVGPKVMKNEYRKTVSACMLALAEAVALAIQYKLMKE